MGDGWVEREECEGREKRGKRTDIESEEE